MRLNHNHINREDVRCQQRISHKQLTDTSTSALSFPVISFFISLIADISCVVWAAVLVKTELAAAKLELSEHTRSIQLSIQDPSKQAIATFMSD